MRTPLVSVVVPTHERAHYAVSTIRSLLELSDEIEVVVSDSSENDAISPAFAGVQASARLKILRPTKKLSVVDNFNFALRSAVGRYVCFIGDDDFVSSELVTIAKWADRHGVDAIKLTFPAFIFGRISGIARQAESLRARFEYRPLLVGSCCMMRVRRPGMHWITWVLVLSRCRVFMRV